MINTRIISAFTACGKSYMAQQYAGNPSIKIFDLDSDGYKYNNDPLDCNINSEWPNNYIEAIKDMIGKADILFISSHKEVRQLLFENSISFDIVVPKATDTCLNEWIGRMTRRNDPNIRIDSLIYTWFNELNEIENECTYQTIYHLSENAFISDVIWLDVAPNNIVDDRSKREVYKPTDIIPDGIEWKNGQKVIFSDGLSGTVVFNCGLDSEIEIPKSVSSHIFPNEYLKYIIVKETGSVIPLTNTKYHTGGYTKDFYYRSRSNSMVIPVWSIDKIYDVLEHSDDDCDCSPHRKLLWEREQTNKK